MTNTKPCKRCGKQNPAQIHTCSPMNTNQEIIEEFRFMFSDDGAIEAWLKLKLEAKDAKCKKEKLEIEEFIEKFGHHNLGCGTGAESLAYEWHTWKDEQRKKLT
ncbi:MAG: hypothetical protein KAS32_16305 [Candidatus Peribacteraceae bacterium]|nr:hypothetical protein [Candidatus Peribacteraceae bacterium]